MSFTKPNQKLCGIFIILVASVMLSSCGLGDVFESYEQISLTPDAVATFSSRDVDACGELINIAFFPPQFEGIGEAAVGHSGSFVQRDEHQIHIMHTAIKFDLDGVSIPLQSVNETMIASLVFIYHLTPRSVSDRNCQVRISSPELASMAWDSTSNFRAPLASTPFTTAGCELITGSRTEGAYSCLVSKAVIDWMRDPGSHPNNGFVIHPPDKTIDSCNSDIGEPGNRLECVTELTSIGLNLQYLPP